MNLFLREQFNPGLHCFPFKYSFLDTFPGIQTDLLEIKDKHGN